MRIRSLLVLVAALAFAISPFLVPAFRGYDPSQFPVEVVDPPVQPAGYAFSIWGVIYLWLIVMAAFGVWRRQADAAWDATRLPLIVSLGLGSVWLPVANASPVWATVLIWAMLVPALVALLRTPRADPWLLRAPVGLYAGWLTAASCVSLGLLVTGYGVPPLGPEGWAVAALSVALAITVAMLKARVALTYGLAVAWALTAVTVRNGADVVGVFSFGAAIAVIVLTIAALRRLA